MEMVNENYSVTLAKILQFSDGDRYINSRDKIK